MPSSWLDLIFPRESEMRLIFRSCGNENNLNSRSLQFVQLSYFSILSLSVTILYPFIIFSLFLFYFRRSPTLTFTSLFVISFRPILASLGAEHC